MDTVQCISLTFFVNRHILIQRRLDNMTNVDEDLRHNTFQELRCTVQVFEKNSRRHRKIFENRSNKWSVDGNSDHSVIAVDDNKAETSLTLTDDTVDSRTLLATVRRFESDVPFFFDVMQYDDFVICIVKKTLIDWEKNQLTIHLRQTTTDCTEWRTLSPTSFDKMKRYFIVAHQSEKLRETQWTQRKIKSRPSY